MFETGFVDDVDVIPMIPRHHPARFPAASAKLKVHFPAWLSVPTVSFVPSIYSRKSGEAFLVRGIHVSFADVQDFGLIIDSSLDIVALIL